MPVPHRHNSADSEAQTRPDMVHWYMPWLLIRIGVRALVATVVGQIADNRELQAVDYRNQDNLWDYSDREELWFDFVADIGDGWEASHAVACALARKALTIAGGPLPRADLLLIGGDLVYPDPGHDAYATRAIAPYQAACEAGEDFTADVFAVPGNHDWYDGLHAFQDMFCHDPAHAPEWPFGCWRKRQTHSYFAQQLPHDWWLLAPDAQLDNRINPSQREYFRRISTHMSPGARVIVIAPFPNWAQVNPDANTAALAWVAKFCTSVEARLALVLTGDLHHYSRYESESSECAEDANATPVLITAGGGGSFLHPTHTLPNVASLSTFSATEEAATVIKKAIWPPAPASRRMALGNLLFPITNWQLSLFIGLVYTMLAWILETRLLLGDATVSALFHNMLESHGGVSGTLARLLAMLPKSPEFALVLLLTAMGLTAFNENCNGKIRLLLGTLHTVLHVVGLIITYCGAIAVTVWLDEQLNTLSFSFFWFLLSMVLLGGGVGGIVFGVFLTLSLNVFGANLTNAFSSLRLSNYRNFLRMHINVNGDLTVRALGIKQPEGGKSVVSSIDSEIVIK